MKIGWLHSKIINTIFDLERDLTEMEVRGTMEANKQGITALFYWPSLKNHIEIESEGVSCSIYNGWVPFFCPFKGTQYKWKGWEVKDEKKEAEEMAGMPDSSGYDAVHAANDGIGGGYP